MVNIGTRIKALRLERRMTQAEVARKIGISSVMICSYENELRSPSYGTLIKLAAFFNVSTDYLLGLEKPPIKYDGLSDREIRAVINIVELLREK